MGWKRQIHQKNQAWRGSETISIGGFTPILPGCQVRKLQSFHWGKTPDIRMASLANNPPRSRIDKIEPLHADPAKLRDFATRYTAAWCGQDAASVAAFYSPSGSLTINSGDPAVGRRAITEVAQSFMTAFPDMRLVMDDIIAQGDRADYHWTLHGTNTGPGGTGHKVRISGFEIWQIGADGLIASSQGHFDRAEYQSQLERGVQELR